MDINMTPTSRAAQVAEEIVDIYCRRMDYNGCLVGGYEKRALDEIAAALEQFAEERVKEIQKNHGRDLDACRRERYNAGRMEALEAVKQECMEAMGYQVEFNKHMEYCIQICERLSRPIDGE